ncbi:MAG: response regulator transcription factor [Bacteroidetes bacterium]|nr:response regulator transcription factor [Bacteroidota bacterium]
MANPKHLGKHKILVVDDEPDILEFIEYNLINEGYEVQTAPDGEEALRIAKSYQPDMVLLDIMMPKMDGVETCRRLRDLPETKDALIVFLTARAEEYSELAGFDAGGDDYVTKPVRPRVLLTRLKALFRRGHEEDRGKASSSLLVTDLRIVRDEFLVYQNDQPINLPKKEFELLFFLASKPGKVFSREVLLEKIWGNDVYVVPRTIDVHIRKLREKLGENYIQTIKGVGYKFVG